MVIPEVSSAGRVEPPHLDRSTYRSLVTAGPSKIFAA